MDAELAYLVGMEPEPDMGHLHFWAGGRTGSGPITPRTTLAPLNPCVAGQ